MTNLTIGIAIKTYTLYLRRESVQSFVLQWFEDEEMTIPMSGIDGDTISVNVGRMESPVHVYTAIVAGHIATFNLVEAETDFDFSLYDGWIGITNIEGTSALVNLRVEIEPT